MANEIQSITLSAVPQHGYFKLTFESEETGEIAYNASAATIQAALEALTTIGSGNVSVSVDGLVITIEFVGALGFTNVTDVTVTANTMGRNTVETLSLSAAPASGNVLAKESNNVSWATLPYTGFTDSDLEFGGGYPSSLNVSGDWYPSGYTLTTPENVTLSIVASDTADAESNPLTPLYTKVQAYSAVTATQSTLQNGSLGPTMVISAPSGLTLTAKIFARGSDTLIETVTLTERTNCLGIYEGNVVEGETGWHHVSIFSGADCIGVQDIYLTAAEIEHYAGDYCPIEDPSGLLSTVGPSLAGIASTVAAVVPTNASIASTVSSVLPTNSSIAATVASAITADHGSGAYTTANVSSLATTSQLAASSAQLLAASWGSGTTANTSLSRDRILEVIAGACSAIITGAGTTTNAVKHLNSTAANMTITVDSSGNRSAVTIH